MGMKESLRLPLQEAKALYDGEQVTVVDVVDADAYTHWPDEIVGAVRIDPDEIEQAYGRLSPDNPILTYCTCDNDEISAKIAYLLRKRGFDAYAIHGGLPAWIQAGYPVQEKEVAARVRGGK